MRERKGKPVTGYKILTYDYRPPLQGGDPLWDGTTLPYVLPKVRLDTSAEDCAAGYNFTADLPTALRIAGLWPNGRPSCCLHVEASKDTIARGDKHRCSELTIVSRVERAEVFAAIRELSEPFGIHADRMADSQVAWFDALGRPRRNVRAVEAGLRKALKVRGLVWKLQRFDDAWAAWDARAARAAWDARAARAAWDAGAARAARDALTVEYAALQEWTKNDPLLLTAGLRDAYAAGLGAAVPVGPDTLGWAMV